MARLHPSNRWLVIATQGGLRVAELTCDFPKEFLLFIGGRYREPSWMADERLQSWRRMQSENQADEVQSTFRAMVDQIQTAAKRANVQMTEETLAGLRADAEKRAKRLRDHGRARSARTARPRQRARGDDRFWL